jgi:hypothetical protein
MSDTLLLAGRGAIDRVDRTPMAWPLAFTNALPESPGMPGVRVYTGWVQPLPSLPRLMPVFGLSTATPWRSEELP